MLKVPPLAFIRRRGRRPGSTPAPPPPPAPGPVLEEATYIDSPTPTLRLVFDREIDLSSYNGNVVVVDVASRGLSYLASGPQVQPTPEIVEFELVANGPYAGTGGRLAAPEMCLILDLLAEPWAGVANLVLPFP